MSFVIVSSADVLYGPTALSTEDSELHGLLGSPSGSGSQLTLSRRRHRHDKRDKYDKVIRKYEHKLADCKERGGRDEKADRIREKLDYLCQREKERIAVNEETKVNFDPNGKSIVFKVEDAPVRVLNRLGNLGYSVLPSAGGSGPSHGHGHGGFVWTLYKPNHVPTPIYPQLNLSSTD